MYKRQPGEFLSANFSKKSFSLIHLNISSLQRHIDELVTLLSILDHPFNVICVTETRLHDDPLTNIQIEGYNFVHTPTSSQCGGVGIFIKENIEYEIVNKHTLSLDNIFQSIFIEIKTPSKKNILVGCVYRHPSPPISEFQNKFLDKTLNAITKSKKTCLLSGDFNIDLIKYCLLYTSPSPRD